MLETYELAKAFDDAAARWCALDLADGWPAEYCWPAWRRHVLTTVHRDVGRVPLVKLNNAPDDEARALFQTINRQFTQRPLPAAQQKDAA